MKRNLTMAFAVFFAIASHCNLAVAGLTAHFDFEEGSGTSTSSAVGGFTGTFVGDPTWETSDLPPVASGTTAAINFDGAGDYILSDYAGIGGSADRSVAFWVKTSSVADAGIVAWGDSQSGDGLKWHVRLNNSGANGDVGAQRTEIQGSYEIGDVAVDDGQWHHLASVYSAGGTFGSGQVQHYVDGALVGESGTGADGVTVNTTTSSTISGNIYPVILGGRNQAGTFSSFDGLLDEIRIYDHALTPSEVAALATPVPEPASIVLAALGLGLIVGVPLVRKRMSAK